MSIPTAAAVMTTKVAQPKYLSNGEFTGPMESMFQCDIERSYTEHRDRQQCSRSIVAKVKKHASRHQAHGGHRSD